MTRRILVAAGILATLAGCAETPIGPTVPVMPPPGKPFEAFRSDDAICRNFAAGQVAGQAEHANNRALGMAALTTVLGAGLGAAVGGGYGAGIGAGSGAVLGSGIGAGSSSRMQGNIQGLYDIAYSQCMYAKGNLVPGAPAPVPPSP